MTENNTSLIQLKTFLNQLFQFDTQDLDFGVYKILHYKKKEIANFIDKLLVDKVKEQLQTLTQEDATAVKEKLAELETSTAIKKWLEAVANNDTTRLEIYQEDYREEIRHYKEVKAKALEAGASVETENQIYNHLTLFFSRYYDKGDFISKRRFGKNEKYMVPYNGEETHFHWANHDQYYIKSSETFSQYAFKVTTADGHCVVNFKLHNAQMEQGNVKADEPNYFILSEKEPEIAKEECTFFFEYRPLTDDEKKTIKGNNKQDVLDEQAFDAIHKARLKTVQLNQLWSSDASDKPLLLKKLNHYTRKNKHDFFIHKNLKTFLQRELDFYIKSELVNVDDLYVTEVDSYFDRLKHNLKKIKVFKAIAETIIDFVSQIEDFQKKLWEKKKFVLSTHWVITIDRLVQYIGEEAAKPILEEVINNPQQVQEWKELFGEENVPKKLSLDTLKADLHEWRKLPIDTGYFSLGFKYSLLNALSESVSINDNLDGLTLHTDNFHGLRLLRNTFSKSIQSIYIDPPYNTNATEILYKNSFKHASWCSFMDSRITEAVDFLKETGIICVTIDDYEKENLSHIMDKIFGFQNRLGVACIRNNPSGRSTVEGFSVNHEYGLFYSSTNNSTIGRLSHLQKQLDRYDEVDEETGKPFEWENFRKNGTDSNRSDRKKQFFPFYVNTENNLIRIPELEWDEDKEEYIILEDPNGNEKVILPIDDNGNEKVWKYGLIRTKDNLTDFLIKKGNDNYQIYRKKFVHLEGSLPRTWWDDAKYSARDNGTREITNLFGNKDSFDFPKSPYAVIDSLKVSSAGKKAVILDFFPGSGTTFHSVQKLNESDNGKRKCLLTEQGQYIYTVIIPRIKKIAFSFEWKNSKPKNGSMNGLGVFFKYQRLEQYEEALENIAFTVVEEAVQQALQLDHYIPKYFLEFETRDSQTLVNTQAMKDPWDYRLKVWDGFTYDTEQAVDLVETFNYLIGLHMQKCITKEIDGKKYQFVLGHNNANKQILAVWRSVKDWKIDDYKADALALKEELKAFTYDLLYINDQAHIEGYQPIEEVFKNKMLN